MPKLHTGPNYGIVQLTKDALVKMKGNSTLFVFAGFAMAGCPIPFPNFE